MLILELKNKRKKMVKEMQKKSIEIDDLCAEIREAIDEGFYPEEYLDFSKKIENKLSKIEEKTTDIFRMSRKIQTEERK